MKITMDTIEHIAELANLNLTEEDKTRLIFDLEQIISYMDKLNELDTSEVKPTEHVIGITNVFREDVAKPSYPREKMMENAPSKEGGFFKVPKVVE